MIHVISSSNFHCHCVSTGTHWHKWLRAWILESDCPDFISSVQLLSCVWLFATPWTAACQASLSITNSWSLLKLMSIELVMASNHFILYCPLLLPPLIFPSIRVFSNELALHIRWTKYWSFSCSISPSNEYSELISFRIDWFDLLVWDFVLAKDTQKVTNTDFLPRKHSLGSSWLWDEGLLLTSRGTMDGKQSVNKWDLVSPC